MSARESDRERKIRNSCAVGDKSWYNRLVRPWRVIPWQSYAPFAGVLNFRYWILHWDVPCTRILASFPGVSFLARVRDLCSVRLFRGAIDFCKLRMKNRKKYRRLFFLSSWFRVTRAYCTKLRTKSRKDIVYTFCLLNFVTSNIFEIRWYNGTIGFRSWWFEVQKETIDSDSQLLWLAAVSKWKDEEQTWDWTL